MEINNSYLISIINQSLLVNMAPAATIDVPSVAELSIKDTARPAPLELSGALDGFEHDDLTPVIGREFINVNIVDDILNAPNADERLREVAITSISFPPQYIFYIS